MLFDKRIDLVGWAKAPARPSTRRTTLARRAHHQHQCKTRCRWWARRTRGPPSLTRHANAFAHPTRAGTPQKEVTARSTAQRRDHPTGPDGFSIVYPQRRIHFQRHEHKTTGRTSMKAITLALLLTATTSAA